MINKEKRRTGMTNKHTTLLLLLLCCSFAAMAQPRFGDERGNLAYRDYEQLINPAISDSVGWRMVSAGVNKQWTGIEGSPMSEILQFRMSVAQAGGIGAWLHNESYGVQQNLQIGAGYSHRIKINSNFLSFGLNVSLLMMNENLVNNLNHPNDAAFAGPPQSQTGFNAGFGAYYFGDKFYTGFSIPQILTNDIKNNMLENSMDFARMQYYITGGYRYDMGNKVSLQPSALLAFSGTASLGYELMLTAVYDRRFEIGAGWMANASMQFLAGGTIIKNLALRYRFTLNTNTDHHAGASHFVVLQYSW